MVRGTGISFRTQAIRAIAFRTPPSARIGIGGGSEPSDGSCGVAEQAAARADGISARNGHVWLYIQAFYRAKVSGLPSSAALADGLPSGGRLTWPRPGAFMLAPPAHIEAGCTLRETAGSNSLESKGTRQLCAVGNGRHIRFAVPHCWSRGDSNRRSHPPKSLVVPPERQFNQLVFGAAVPIDGVEENFLCGFLE